MFHTVAAELDDIGKPAWIALTVVSFIIFWPLGLVLLGYLIGSGRMGCWAHNGNRWQRRMERMQRRMERMQSAASRWSGGGSGPSSGNWAFDEYRADMLRRLEEEQREFKEFLDRLADRFGQRLSLEFRKPPHRQIGRSIPDMKGHGVDAEI